MDKKNWQEKSDKTASPFRSRHLFTFLAEWDRAGGPLDLLLSRYFKSNSSLGSKDRAWLGETLFSIVRNQILLDALIDRERMDEGLWESRLKALQRLEKNPKIAEAFPPWIRYSIPEFLWHATEAVYGDTREALFAAFLEQAPIALRTNLLKISRDDLYDRLKNQFSLRKSMHSQAALILDKREPLFALPEFKEGLFEMQDEGSQEIADLVEVQPKQWLLDYCAGSGGKTLAVAHKMKGSGQIYLHDIRKSALLEARKRLKRAGIQNSQLLFSEESDKKKKLKGRMDFVILDVPCSGTGTLRRNPEMKSRLSEEDVKRLAQLQRTLFEEALVYVKKGGKILYATCSLLQTENEDQVTYFVEHFPVKLVSAPKRTTLPSDILFGALFTKEIDI